MSNGHAVTPRSESTVYMWNAIWIKSWPGQPALCPRAKFDQHTSKFSSDFKCICPEHSELRQSSILTASSCIFVWRFKNKISWRKACVGEIQVEIPQTPVLMLTDARCHHVTMLFVSKWIKTTTKLNTPVRQISATNKIRRKPPNETRRQGSFHKSLLFKNCNNENVVNKLGDSLIPEAGCTKILSPISTLLASSS